MQVIENVIGGKRARSSSPRVAPVFNPATGEQSASLPLSTKRSWMPRWLPRNWRSPPGPTHRR